MESIEEWRDIPGHEGLYQVSDLGRINSIGHRVKRVLNPHQSSRYASIVLCSNGNKKATYVHVVVAMAFLGHIPNGWDIVVDHIDGDKRNNRASNLQLISNRENINKSPKNVSSKYDGVSFNKNANKFHATIRVGPKHHNLGCFSSEADAGAIYLEALRLLNNSGVEAVDGFVESLKIERKSKTSSKYKHVLYHKANNKWVSRPRFNGKKVYIGSFKTEEEAHQAIIKWENQVR